MPTSCSVTATTPARSRPTSRAWCWRGGSPRPTRASTNYQADVSVHSRKHRLHQVGSPATRRGARRLQESLALRRRLAEAEKTGTKWRQNISLTLEKIGDLKQGANDDAGALAAYEEMLANDRELAAADPDAADRQRDVSIDLEKIAKVKLDAGDSDGALAPL